eukprot:TRINITY_DN4280_c2_g1_i1.p1 TRINITY_DN4280_c2_g1~~TRINITY_DN4280_c2_g1_i1.p1  ORF type:complete len:306 (+),score=64.00 TRINITY_DN4280_c2_g1_i1:45-962(+)
MKRRVPTKQVFSGVPPPDLQALSLQKNLDEVKSQVADLTRKLAESHDEVLHLRQCYKVFCEVPDVGPYDSTVLQQHAEYVEEVLRGGKKIPHAALGAMEEYCSDLHDKLVELSGEVMSKEAEIQMVKLKYDTLERSVLMTPRVLNSDVVLKMPMVVSTPYANRRVKTTGVGTQTDKRAGAIPTELLKHLKQAPQAQGAVSCIAFVKKLRTCLGCLNIIQNDYTPPSLSATFTKPVRSRSPQDSIRSKTPMDIQRKPSSLGALLNRNPSLRTGSSNTLCPTSSNNILVSSKKSSLKRSSSAGGFRQ